MFDEDCNCEIVSRAFCRVHGDCASKYINDTLNERHRTHGDYSDTARIAQSLKVVLWTDPAWMGLSLVQKESIDLICTKLARIMSGNPNTKDHWDDIAGYANLVGERLQ